MPPVPHDAFQVRETSPGQFTYRDAAGVTLFFTDRARAEQSADRDRTAHETRTAPPPPPPARDARGRFQPAGQPAPSAPPSPFPPPAGGSGRTATSPPPARPAGPSPVARIVDPLQAFQVVQPSPTSRFGVTGLDGRIERWFNIQGEAEAYATFARAHHDHLARTGSAPPGGLPLPGRSSPAGLGGVGSALADALAKASAAAAAGSPPPAVPPASTGSVPPPAGSLGTSAGPGSGPPGAVPTPAGSSWAAGLASGILDIARAFRDAIGLARGATAGASPGRPGNPPPGYTPPTAGTYGVGTPSWGSPLDIAKSFRDAIGSGFRGVRDAFTGGLGRGNPTQVIASAFKDFAAAFANPRAGVPVGFGGAAGAFAHRAGSAAVGGVAGLAEALIDFPARFRTAMGVLPAQLHATASTLIGVGLKLDNFAENQLDKNRRYTPYSGTLSTAFAMLDVGDQLRAFRVARSAEVTGANLTNEVNALREGWVGLDKLKLGIGNRLGQGAAALVGPGLRAVGDLAGQGADWLNANDPKGNWLAGKANQVHQQLGGLAGLGYGLLTGMGWEESFRVANAAIADIKAQQAAGIAPQQDAWSAFIVQAVNLPKAAPARPLKP